MSPIQKKIFTNWLLIPFVGSLVICFIVEALQGGDFKEYIESVVVSMAYWSLLANGNGYVIELIDKRWTWIEAPVKRTAAGVVAMIVVTFIISTLVIYVFIEFYLGYSFADQWERDGLLMYVIPFSITLIISLWLHGRGFLLEWREAAMNVERLKTENIKSKFESLRNQVNPHFLFNSLNALTSLVYDDQTKAVKFIQKLSDVYRYVLDHQNDEIVSLEKELKFLESFIYLNKIRFGENLHAELPDIGEVDDTMSIPPVVLQILVENSLKHNEASSDRPLKISIRLENDRVVVENIKNPLTFMPESKGMGLENIKMRYEILSDEQVEISDTKESFKVSVPILKLMA